MKNETLTEDQARELLRSEIEKSGQSQAKFAELHGLDPAVLSKVLNGRRGFSGQLLTLLRLKRDVRRVVVLTRVQ